MAESWTTEAVLALAPTERAAVAARNLNPRAFSQVGCSARALWAWCRSSGATSYQVMVDLEGPAWRCSCPSRQSPCKHVLGLLLVWVRAPGGTLDASPPDAVGEWLEQRDRRASRSARRTATGPSDPEAQARRADQRQARIGAGMAELDRWLGDLVRQGLVTARQQPQEFWDGIAARMVDAQAPSVAERLRGIPSRIGDGEDWPQRLLDELGALHLITAGWSRLQTLPPETQADLRTAVGWPYSAEQVAAGERVGDRWVVIGKADELAGRVHTYRTWLLGVGSGRHALLLGFAPVNQRGFAAREAVPDHAAWPLWHTLDAELAFYPGSVPLRARVTDRGDPAGDPWRPADPGTLPAWAVIDDALADHAAAVARNPWLGAYPVLLDGVIPVERDGGWLVRDRAGALLPLRRSPGIGPDIGWILLDHFGGHPAGVFGELRGGGLAVLSWAAAERLTRRATTATPSPATAIPGPGGSPVASAGAGLGASPAASPGDSPAASAGASPGVRTGDSPGVNTGASSGQPTAAAAVGVAAALPELTGTALAGTERRPPGGILSGRGAATAALSRLAPEPALLATAAAAATVRRAGTLAADDTEPVPEPAPADPQPCWASDDTARLSDLLGHPKVGMLLPEWLEAVAAAGLRAADGSTRRLIEHGDATPAHRAALVGVLGERGRWLASRHPKGQWVEWWAADADTLEDRWHQGDQPQLALERLRALDPARGRALLEAAWPNLESPAVRRAHLDALENGLSLADEPLLETALDDDPSDRVPWHARHLLVRLPGAALRERMTARAKALVGWRTSGGRLQLHVDPDATAPTDASAVRDLIFPTNRVWLRLVVGSVPIGFWAGYAGRPAQELVAAAWYSDQSPHLVECVLDGWWDALEREPDPDWIAPLLWVAEALEQRRRGSMVRSWDPVPVLAQLRPEQDALEILARLVTARLADPLDWATDKLLRSMRVRLPVEPSRLVLRRYADALRYVLGDLGATATEVGRSLLGFVRGLGDPRPWPPVTRRPALGDLGFLGALLDPSLIDEARELLEPIARSSRNDRLIQPIVAPSRPDFGVGSLIDTLAFSRDLRTGLRAAPA